jgi:hypothetical protein
MWRLQSSPWRWIDDRLWGEKIGWGKDRKKGNNERRKNAFRSSTQLSTPPKIDHITTPSRHPCVPVCLSLVPDDNTISPPTQPLPTVTYTAPPAPTLAPPEPIITAPLLPDDAVPVDTTRNPLTPAAPALAVWMTMLPEVVVEL